MKMIFDLTATPYSVRGSNIALIDQKGLKVYSSIRGEGHHYLAINFMKNGKTVSPEFAVDTDKVVATYKGASCEMCLYGKSGIALKNRGFDIFIEPYGSVQKGFRQDNFGIYSVPYSDGHFSTVSCPGHYFATYYFYKGTGKFVPKKFRLFRRNDVNNCFLVEGDADMMIGLADEQLRFSDVEFDLTAMESKVEKDWLDFLSKMPTVPQKYEEFAKMTWFTLWSNMVPASRHFKKDTVVMGKVGMPSVWSWDHCFNALATDFYSFHLGWTQFEAPYLYRFDNGALPDALSNSHLYVGIVKPPVHGWCFAKLMERHPDLPDELLEKTEDYLKKQAEYWLLYRDSDGDGVPDYPQGCDSGLDNATVFIDTKYKKQYRRFVEAPDLPSYLALQYDTLAKIAVRLGKDGGEYLSKRDELLQKIISHFGSETGFVSKSTHSHEVNVNAKSIIDLMPIVLGNLLPKDWKDKTVAKLKKENLTAYGVASESPSGIYYRPNGYWRGPIWAPTTYLIIDGLRRMGERELAKDLTERYLNMVVNVAKGNYENYDALTGKGYCVKGHTWTASVTMLLMNELANDNF